MIRKSFCQQAASFAVALTLSIPSFGFAADAPATKLIFPGDPLPKELGFSPLKVGTGGDAEVQVMARDWFLLKDKNLVLLKPVLGKTLDVNGPILEPNNTQIYFRLMSGMILKESLVQMGMNAGQAKRFIEKAGADFDKVSLENLTDKNLSYLYENWDRTSVRMVMIPRMLLPLAVAYDQSQLQHFAKAGLNDQDAQKTCSTITTAAPIAQVQAKIDDTQKQMDSINTDLRNAQARLAQSKAEQGRLNGGVKDISTQIDNKMHCFDVIKTRTSRGGAMPDQNCLNLAAGAMNEAKLSAEWTKFVTVSLPNDQGDETVKNQKETEVNALAARVAETQNVVQALQKQEDQAKQDQAAAEDKLKRLNEVYGPEKSKSADLDKELEDLKAELLQLQTLDFNLNPGVKSEMTEDQKKAAIDATPDRKKRMADIDARSKAIVPEQVKRQAYQASILTQIQGVTATIDEKKAQIATLEVQLNDPTNGYVGKLATLQAQLDVETPKYISIKDRATFSEYVVAVLMKNLAMMGQNRDAQYKAVSDEEARAKQYEAEIVAANKTKDDRYDQLAADIKSLEALVASYHDVAQMGWFLETDCNARANFSGQQPGIYLSRAKMTNNFTKDVPTTPVDGGKWGLFNLDFQHFQAPIQSGILLNVPAYVQMSVQQILENYDFAVTQILDPAVTKCADDSAKGSAAVLSMMKTASAIWSEGADADAKTKAFQCRVNPTVAATPAPATQMRQVRNKKGQWVLVPVPTAASAPKPISAISSSTFSSSLSRLMSFDGSVLDAGLPQTGQARPEDLIERQAISLVGRELSILGGTSRSNADDSLARRDQLIKALLLVLAFDYEGEIAHQAELSKAQNKIQYIFATNPPVKVATPTGMTAGSNYFVKTLGSVRLYTQPIAKPAYQTNIALSMNDVVQVLSIDQAAQAPDLVRDGWVKVQGPNNQELWMPAWPLSPTLLDENAHEVQGLGQIENCPNPRAVLSLNSFDGRAIIPRFATNVSTRETYKKSGMYTIDENKTATVTPASTTKTYIACQNLEVEGQSAMNDIPAGLKTSPGIDFSKVQAVRIVEVKVLHAANGRVIYLPQEATGGFVQTWAPKGKGMAPRINLGAEIDPASWSLR